MTDTGKIKSESEITNGEKVPTTIQLIGSGAIAQGDNAQSVGAGGLLINGNIENSNSITGNNNQMVIYQGQRVTIPFAEAIARHRVALKTKMEEETKVRWGAYYIQEEGATLPIEASPYQTEQLGARKNLQDSLKSVDRMLLLGDPGSGKTVALEHLAWELCGGKEPVIPVLIKLFKYDGKPLAEWVRTRLQECDCLRLDDQNTLTVFLQEGSARCIFLFDGLNEVAPEYRTILVGELDRWISAYPRHAVIITSRVQDELWRKLREGLPAMVVQPIHNEQARAYLIAHLNEKGDELYRRLDERLRGLMRTPLVLWLIKEAGVAGESMPTNRGELYKRFVERMLQRDKDREMDVQLSKQMKERALSTLALHFSRMQRLTCPRHEVMDVVAGTFEKDVPDKLNKAEVLVKACARHGLLAGDDELWFAPHQTVQEHFAAVALQETVQQEQRLSSVARLGLSAQKIFTRQKIGLNALASEDWWMETLVQLAGIIEDPNWLARAIARTNPWLAWWCVQEGKTVDETTRVWIEERSNKLLNSPKLADRRRAVQTLARIHNERVLRPLLQAAVSGDREVASIAVQGLADMGEAARATVVELLHGMDERLWELTLNSLSIPPESPFWTEIAGWIRTDGELLNQARHRLQKQAASITYKKGNFESLLKKMAPMNSLARIENGVFKSQYWKAPWGEPEWITIPAGEFWMGNNKSKYLDDKPAHKLYLPEYQIAPVPVTRAQYAIYVKDSGAPPPKWHGKDVPQGLENHPVTYVKWTDALAYCQWLSEKINKPITLPSEAEWEKAARGPARDSSIERIYPWGDEFDEFKCNTSELGLNRTTPIDMFLNGASPYGVLDMSGNVWEWTRSIVREWNKEWEWESKDSTSAMMRNRVIREFGYPYDATDGREDIKKTYRFSRVQRGGSHYNFSADACCTYRRDIPSDFGWHHGFRVVIASQLTEHFDK